MTNLTLVRNTLLLLVTLTLFSGCAARQGDFTLLSTKNVEVSRIDMKNVDLERNTKGSDGRFWFLFIPFGPAPTLEEASDDALEEGGGDFMTSAVVYRRQYHLGLFGWESWIVKGDVGDSLSRNSREMSGYGTRRQPNYAMPAYVPAPTVVVPQPQYVVPAAPYGQGR